jgi:hypothetical protein
MKIVMEIIIMKIISLFLFVLFYDPNKIDRLLMLWEFTTYLDQKEIARASHCSERISLCPWLLM